MLAVTEHTKQNLLLLVTVRTWKVQS